MFQAPTRLAEMMSLSPTILVRFANKFKRGDVNVCWPWSGATVPKGYGKLAVANNKFVYAHRFSWLLHRGVIPASLWVLHSCDFPGCVNPNHLFLGDHLANMADMRAKGRGTLAHTYTRGERNGMSKLCPCAVLTIRHLYDRGVGMTSITRRFPFVGKSAVSKVCYGQTWRHVRS